MLSRGLDEEEEEDDNLAVVKEAVEKATGVVLAGIQDEIEEIIHTLNINQEGYQEIWYKFHTAPDAKKWTTQS